MEFTQSDKQIREALCQELVSLSQTDQSIIVLDSDLMASSGLKGYQDAFPHRLYNCGIQEQNMIGVAGGLSSMGFKPFVHSFAAFASRRVFDQLYMLGGYAGQSLFVLSTDPGILNCANGATHMANEDIAMMSAIPNATIVDFTDQVMLKALLPQLLEKGGLVYMRIFRKTQNVFYDQSSSFTLGKANVLAEGCDATIITSGALMVPEALKAAKILAQEGISCRVVDMFTIKPLDRNVVLDSASRTGRIVTVENHNTVNGLGSAVADVLAQNKIAIPFKKLGVPDTIGETASVPYLLEKYKMSAQHIVNAVKTLA